MSPQHPSSGLTPQVIAQWHEALGMGEPVLGMVQPLDREWGLEPVFFDLRPWLATAGQSEVEAALAAVEQEFASVDERHPFEARAFAPIESHLREAASSGESLVDLICLPNLRGSTPNLARLMGISSSLAMVFEPDAAQQWVKAWRPALDRPPLMRG